MNIPELNLVSQDFNHQPVIKDIEQQVLDQLENIKIKEIINENDKIAITAGSRGIKHIDVILATVVKIFKNLGAQPFIVPSMGSHGGGTSEGRVEVLNSLGINEKTVGAPIISDNEVLELDRIEEGATVYMDKNAYNADAIFVVNRVKPHTKFKANIESGLMKMIAIGLGKQTGCTELHSYGLYPAIINAARIALNSAPIKAGLGIVENAAKQIADIKAARKEEIEKVDKELLSLAKELMPSLSISSADLLIVEEMGKDISGSGLDVNVIGRVTSSVPNDEKPRIDNIVVLDLTEASHGNALGMGLVDVITQRFADKIDFKATYANIIASGSLGRGKMPIVQENDRDAISVALNSLQAGKSEEPKIVFIKNTLDLTKFMVSKPLLNELSDNFNILDKVSLEFDRGGYLIKKGW